ncbi:DUF1707 domain-containing protein [Nocardiopsis sp. CT-R113]|uniref:DUF1707 domain-containing protein n=1 Tax=Nocardiopsis codii TaxID=3065942 RepID=A0ABU7K3C8_9ACTN|nr:DUF1707 domain-containing protein [Nocardiopsis sp. CT-R113]MEE2036752.1 DUF1707 domain-containing protein [Nocardiopsis sp. CT-R113]
MEGRSLPLSRMRASDAERDQAVDRLTVAFVEGRLDHEEYDRRVGLALTAVLVGDLRPLTADLPGPEPQPHRAAPHRDPRFHGAPSEGDLSVLSVPWREWGDEWRWWTGVATALTGVWGAVSLMGGELVPYWPLVPLGIWAAVLLASAIWPSDEEPP